MNKIIEILDNLNFGVIGQSGLLEKFHLRDIHPCTSDDDRYNCVDMLIGYNSVVDMNWLRKLELFADKLPQDGYNTRIRKTFEKSRRYLNDGLEMPNLFVSFYIKDYFNKIIIDVSFGGIKCLDITDDDFLDIFASENREIGLNKLGI